MKSRGSCTICKLGECNCMVIGAVVQSIVLSFCFGDLPFEAHFCGLGFVVGVLRRLPNILLRISSSGSGLPAMV
jgi:hypothetical protein